MVKSDNLFQFIIIIELVNIMIVSYFCLIVKVQMN